MAGLAAANLGTNGTHIGHHWADMCTDAGPDIGRLNYGLCATLKPKVDRLKDSFERHSLDLWCMNYELQHAMDSLQEEMSTLKPTNTRKTIAIMASSLETFFVVGSFLGPSVKKAWMGKAIAQMDHHAAVRKNADEGVAQEAGGAAAAPPGKAPAAKATTTQEAGGGAAAPPGKAPAAKATATQEAGGAAAAPPGKAPAAKATATQEVGGAAGSSRSSLSGFADTYGGSGLGWWF